MAYYDTQNVFTGMIDEQGIIWECGTGRKRQAIGIDVQKEQEYKTQISEMHERLDEYYAKLVEVGVITPPKSAEQIAQEQAAQQTLINAKLLEVIEDLKSKLDDIEKSSSEKDEEPAERSVIRRRPKTTEVQ